MIDPCETPRGLSSLIISPTSVKVKWSFAPMASKYEVRYSEADITSWTKIVKNSTQKSCTLAGLIAGNDYKWQIRTKCSTGIYTSWSTDQYFTTPLKIFSPDKETEASIFIYPNPAISEFTISLELNEYVSDKVQIQILNSYGEEMKNDEAIISNGMLEATIHLDNTIPAGIYFVKISAGSRVYTEQLVLQK